MRRSLPGGGWATWTLSASRRCPLQGLDQARRVCGHNDEVVGERGQTPQVQHDDVGGKFLRGNLYDQLRDFRRFQLLGLQVFDRITGDSRHLFEYRPGVERGQHNPMTDGTGQSAPARLVYSPETRGGGSGTRIVLIAGGR